MMHYSCQIFLQINFLGWFRQNLVITTSQMSLSEKTSSVDFELGKSNSQNSVFSFVLEFLFFHLF